MRILSVVHVLLLVLLWGLFGSAPAPAQSQDTTSTPLQEALTTVDRLRGEGHFRKAQDRLTELRQEHPNDVDVLWRQVFTLADLGKATDSEEKRQQYYQRALAAAETALTSDSSSGRAHLAMAVAEGRMALSAGTREKVERSRAVKHHADRAIALDTTLPGAYHVRGRWHREVAGLGFFQRAIVRTVYGGLPDASYEQAVRDFKRAIELESAAFHHLELGRTYLSLERPAEARREFQTVLDLPRSDPFDPLYESQARDHLEALQ